MMTITWKKIFFFQKTTNNVTQFTTHSLNITMKWGKKRPKKFGLGQPELA